MNITKGQKKKKSIEFMKRISTDSAKTIMSVTLRATADIGFIKTPNSKRK